jgi:hypothetical protein
MFNRVNRRLFFVVTLVGLPGFGVSAQEHVTAPRATQAAEESSDLVVAKEVSSNKQAQNGILELKWEDLVPPGYSPYEIFEKYDIDSLDDSDPQAAQLMAELREAWSMAPVVKELDGKHVKIPGFVVPLEHEGEKISEFLLVPYYGACIHVPPPPANQTVYVVTKKGNTVAKKLFDTVWVTGIMSAKWTGNEVGDSGYTLRASEITPYEEN